MPSTRTISSANAERSDAEDLREDQEQDEGDEGGDHEHVAVGEVHHADDAEHHRVADGDEPVDGAECQTVDQLLNEIIHVPPRSHAPADARTAPRD